MLMALGEAEPVQMTPEADLAIPMSITDSARVGEECGAPWPRPDDWEGCAWYQSYIKQPDGSCACEFSVRNAAGMAVAAPGMAIMGAGEKFGLTPDLGFGGGVVVMGLGGIVWLGLGWWLWKSTKGGK